MVERRNGCRATNRPISGPAAMAAGHVEGHQRGDGAGVEPLREIRNG